MLKLPFFVKKWGWGKLKRFLFIALLVVFACEDKVKEPLSKPYIPS